MNDVQITRAMLKMDANDSNIRLLVFVMKLWNKSTTKEIGRAHV